MANKIHKFLVAPDKFRGSLSSSQALHAVKMGILGVQKDASISEFLMTDGGDGFVDAIADAYSKTKKSPAKILILPFKRGCSGFDRPDTVLIACRG